MFLLMLTQSMSPVIRLSPSDGTRLESQFTIVESSNESRAQPQAHWSFAALFRNASQEAISYVFVSMLSTI